MKCKFCSSDLIFKDKFKVFYLCNNCPNLTYANKDNAWYFWNIEGKNFITVHPGKSITVSARDEANYLKTNILFKDEDNYDLHPQNIQSFLNKILSMKAFI